MNCAVYLNIRCFDENTHYYSKTSHVKSLEKLTLSQYNYLIWMFAAGENIIFRISALCMINDQW